MEELLWKQVFRHEKRPVLHLSIRRPKFGGERRAERKMERYYAHMEELWRARWQNELLPKARSAAEKARQEGAPFFPWRCSLDYSVALESAALLSLSVTVREDAGDGQPVFVRSACTWDLNTGTPRPLFSFFPPKAKWRRTVLNAVRSEADRQVEQGSCAFDRDYPKKLRRAFDPANFYFDRNGLCVFYPLFALGPYAEGIATFRPGVNLQP